ncbi:hypothetical protein SCHIN_v1c05500 [Spiroplasma chinense]|uniref:Uncharacterized protein n=1 Tax=Spiroplasma chinense TaxID=216932 RepID=A0A5B9Y639_9MOLU|nr:hypothetical protein [Spiroplasma chinense]QEH61747.1 hypothetical protein SCHIN_v1c05500 [Spiroplasma chinense]
MKLPINEKEDKKIYSRAKKTAKILSKNERFIFNFLKPLLLSYMENTQLFFNKNLSKIEEIKNKLSMNLNDNKMFEKLKDELSIIQKLDFLIRIVDGFDFENKEIRVEFLSNEFSIVKNDEEKEFNEQLNETTKYFEDLHIEEEKKIISFSDLYEIGNFILSFVLTEAWRINFLENFIIKDIKEDVMNKVMKNEEEAFLNIAMNSKNNQNFEKNNY